MILHFKVGRNKLHFLWCSSLRITNSRKSNSIKPANVHGKGKI